MTIYNLKSPVKIYSNAEYGKRILFVKGPTNPRDELGKIGINFHNRFSRLFYKTIQLELNLINEDNTNSTHLFYVNRNSLVKYLQTFNTALDLQSKTDEELVKILKHNLWKVKDLNEPGLKYAKKQGDVGEKTLRHEGTHNKKPLSGWKSSFSNSVTGKLLSWLYQKAIGSLSRIKALFFIFVRKEADQMEVSEVLARRQFQAAANHVPAYQQHLATNGGIKTGAAFFDIPITSKDNYIKKNTDQDWELHKEGRYPRNNKTDTSTGTTGKPTPWVRSAKEVDVVKKSLKIAVESDLGNRPIEYINAFAFGPWATGMTTYEFMRSTGSVFASGPDMDKIIDKLESIHAYQNALLKKAAAIFISKNPALKNQSKQINSILAMMVKKLISGESIDSISSTRYPNLKDYFPALKKLAKEISTDRPQIIVAGYPPFLKDLINYAQKKEIKFEKYQARAVVGGQAISEALRDKLMEGGFKRVTSSYGASDLDINLGTETIFEQGLRKAIEKNPGLARELFGRNKGLPMIFHYDPLNYHVEVQEDDELIFTCNRSDRSSPRIRYDLGDKGRVYAVSDVEALLLKYGIHHLKPNSNLPLLFVWGREADVIYGGANVGFTDLERAITTEDKSEECLKYAFYSYEDSEGTEQFDIWIELKEGVAIPDKKTSEDFLTKILLRIANDNQDFAYQVKILPQDTPLPGLRFFSRKMSPIQDADGHRKQVLVFKNGKNLGADYKVPEAASDSCRFSIKVTQEFKAALNAKPNPVNITKEHRSKRNSSQFQFAGATAETNQGQSNNNRTAQI